jgi:lysophospholipase L1-like esterase
MRFVVYRAWAARIVCAAAIALVSAVSPAGATEAPGLRGPETPGRVRIPDLRVLFVGNSLTASNELPLVVQALAAAQRGTWAVQAVTLPGASLEDHWANGQALRALRSERWDVVILQQGPSSLPESRVNLREWTRRWAGEIHANGARPALFMVWPGLDRQEFFADVRESYSLAASDVGGIFIPAGEALRLSGEVDPAAPLYVDDGFHPSVAGTYAAALSIFGVLSGTDPLKCPTRVRLADGTVVEIASPLSQLLQTAASEANRLFSRR